MPPEERALLAAIIADRDDDTVRLAYADWLDEHDQPERADYIRVQCAVARLVIDDPATEARYDELFKRQSALRVEYYERRWHEEFAATLPPNGLTDYWFIRGLIGHVRCTPEYFQQAAAELVAAAPFERLALTEPTPRTMAETVANPHFAHFPRLRLDADGMTTEVIRPLLASDLRHLRRLALRSIGGYSDPSQQWSNRNAGVVELIAACGSLSGLDVLDFRNAGVGERGAFALCDSPSLAGVRVLLLNGHAFSTEAKNRLLGRFGDRVYFDYLDYSGRLTFGEVY